MKILIVFTGGTIGSSVSDGFADVDVNTSKLLLDLFSERSDIEFECISPFNILSENSTCDTLEKLCNFMLRIDFDSYDGVIITHGSDTLAYTSAMLGLVLSWVRIPVVITAADYVLSMPQSNGKANFIASVDFIRGFAAKLHRNTGVFTIWKNKDESVKVYISTRLNEADGFSDSFSSWGGTEFGTLEEGIFKRTESSLNPEFTEPCEKTAVFRRSELSFGNRILLVQSYVGLDFGSVSVSGKSAVLLKLYHSATACAEGEKTSFTEFAKRCLERGTDVYIYPAKRTEYKYKSAESIDSGSVIPLYNMNTPSAYCKLLLCYSAAPELRSVLLAENLFYEEL